MRKQKILIVLFAGSLVLPGVVWAGFSADLIRKTMKTENWLISGGRIWNLWETSRSSLRRIIRIMCPSKMTW